VTNPFSGAPHAVTICEVGPRDGLQNEAVAPSTDDKVRFCDLLTAAGITMLEAGSFVNPKAVPQMADSDAVFARISRPPGHTYIALCANERGLDRALAAGVRAIGVFTAASEPFVRANIGLSIDESLAAFAPLIRRAKEDGIWVRASVSTAFGCPFAGEVPVEAVVAVCNRLLEAGADQLSVADTIGVATPNQVVDVVEALAPIVPPEALALHFHDTRGTALANALTGLALGVQTFDTAAGGLGGCPFAPGATGNGATEDLVYALHGMGIETGIDLTRLRAASRFIAAKLGHAPVSRAYSALEASDARVSATSAP
jgi:isopropylmalate/homocitrate/citramalate synthase